MAQVGHITTAACVETLCVTNQSSGIGACSNTTSTEPPKLHFILKSCGGSIALKYTVKPIKMHCGKEKEVTFDLLPSHINA